MSKIVVTELMWPRGLEELRSCGSVVYDPEMWTKPEELVAEVTSADALIVRNATRVDASLLEAGRKLRVVGRLGVGLDNIDLAAARRRRLPVVYARNANATSVAEYVMAALLEGSRKLYEASASVRRGDWNRKQFTGAELYGKTLGLIGLGETARRVAKRARAFEMGVLGYDPYVAPYDYPVMEGGIEMVELADLLRRADFVSLHVPLTSETRHMISRDSFKMMRHDAWIINASRGGVLDEMALAAALNEGLIAGAVLDVLEEEPPPPDNPLLKQDRVILTPHVAGLTEESQERISLLIAREVIRVLKGGHSLCLAT
ncbi:hydroxyacid dehydrogenase [Rubrobacter calidifluminis]|uniref:hydroxyacid dehydrogenase n=1 Tax=Rubrobacter calidifluminis TaxID=1392640 RepID=UPI002360C867|nr:hydroxyacid dehydrogenase [Rubrobacter calidifluminis]